MSRRGIIPARAGFTVASEFCSLRARDHPRSRGVYFNPGLDTELGQGSSPLARGLHHGPPERNQPMRIIPARAGFTYSTFSESLYDADHPRSRGVYGLTLNPAC